MARKVFISYKYKDEMVAKLQDFYSEQVDGKFILNRRNTRVRDYVDLIQQRIGVDNINLGERDGESLKSFSDQAIETSLKQRIRQCSVTLVVISKGMKTNNPENDQWIPWEISYSLRVIPMGAITKQRNAVLGIVLPDENASYNWYYTHNPHCRSITHHTEQLFRILKKNMFNIIDKEYRECNGSRIHTKDEPSFVKTVRWDDFMRGEFYSGYLDKAIEIRDKEELYEIHVNLD